MRRLVFVIAALGLSAPAFADAAALYKTNCAICHGPDGAGKTPTGKALKVRDLRSRPVQKMKNKEIAAVIADGKKAMPSFKAKLSQAEIDELVAFIRKLKK